MHGHTATNPIDVLLVDDAPDLTSMLSTMLSFESDLRVVGTLHEAGGLAEAVARLRPRVVLLDLTMPGKPPLEALIELKAESNSNGTHKNACSVIVYSGRDDSQTTAAAMAAGAFGTLSKATDPAEVAVAIRRAAQSA